MVGIGVVGVGGIGSGAHIPGIQATANGKVVAICDIDAEKLKRVGDQLGLDAAHRFTDYHDLVACSDVDAVEVCTPNYLHCEIALTAVRAGKAINVEKPLDVSLEATQALARELEIHRVPNMMCFSYRFKSAVRYAKEILDQGLIGEIFTVNVAYQQSGALIPGRRLEWRFEKEKSGTGALGDLGAHLIDMAMLLCGDIKSVSAQMGTAVQRRRRLDSEEYADVNVDDYCNFVAKFASGASGTFGITKCAIGHSNTIKFEVFGREGVISFNLNEPDTLDVCIGKIDVESNGLHTIQVPVRYRLDQEQTFVNLVEGKEAPLLPTIADGIRCQKVLDAVQRSAEMQTVINL